jgi:hypothetical protein
MNNEDRTFTLHDNWTAVLSENGNQIDFCNAGTVAFSMRSLAWSLMRPKVGEANSGLQHRTPTCVYGDYAISTDVVQRTMPVHYGQKLVLTMTAAEIDGLHVMERAVLKAYRQAVKA